MLANLTSLTFYIYRVEPVWIWLATVMGEGTDTQQTLYTSGSHPTETELFQPFIFYI